MHPVRIVTLAINNETSDVFPFFLFSRPRPPVLVLVERGPKGLVGHASIAESRWDDKILYHKPGFFLIRSGVCIRRTQDKPTFLGLKPGVHLDIVL